MRSRRSRRLLKMMGLAAAAALIAAGIATAASRHGHHHKLARTHTHRLARAASVTGTFAVLEREPTAADSENGEVVATAQNDPGLRPAAARALQVGPNGRRWLIPTDRGELCLGVQPAGQYEALERERGLEHLGLAYACAPTATVEAQGLVLRVYDEVVGIVPDGVSSVSTTLAGEAPEKQAVAGNTYRLTVHDGFQEGWFSFHDPNGVEQTGRL